MSLRAKPYLLCSFFIVLIIAAVLIFIGFFEITLRENPLAFLNPTRDLVNPFIALQKPKELPLQRYSILNLQKYDYQASEIVLTELVEEHEKFTTHLFSYNTLGKKMTGIINVPHSRLNQKLPAIIMIRGYADPEQYYPGFGTQSAATVFADNGFLTLAIDFLGFAEADPEPEDSWEARFIKPINIIELIQSLQTKTISLQIPDDDNLADKFQPIIINPNKIGIWAHSNGGQIALTVLQIMQDSIPTTLWAPVTAPFPYSILFFTRTDQDEGKETRTWLALLEQDYDVLEFSITQHLDQLTGPIQIHHGGQDQDAPKLWSDYFAELITAENEIRIKENEDTKPQIEFSYFGYPDADHNLQPLTNWQEAIQRDLSFFNSHFN
jgi:hypothetical protein